jgi:2',3'-cyclic-nucleotide 2'-phosphodiesterase (5'-nucleotidase family)
MNAVGYDAMALGNHELDLGAEAAIDLIELADFPVLCANLVRADTGEPFTSHASHVIEVRGIRVGLFALILDNLSEVVAAEPLRELTVLPGVEAARSEIGRLDPESDVIIALAHQGLGACRDLARQVPEIDVILAAHDHRRTEEPIVESGVLIVEAGSRLERLGRLDLKVAGDRVVDHRYELLDLPASDTASVPAAVNELYADIDAMIQAQYGEVIGELAAPFVRDSRHESNLGNWVTDAMRVAAGAQFAVTNSTGLRADVDAGPLTRRAIQEISPFPNVLCTFQATGAELLGLARLNARKALDIEPRGGGIVQVSGLEYAYGTEGEIAELLVGGRPVDPRAIYLGATSDYILESQAERYLGFIPEGIECTSQSIFDVLCDAAARTSPVAARVEGRIRALSAEPAPAPVAAGKAGSS